MSIPVSVIVATRNEAAALPRCLNALRDFSEIIVVDSASGDGTAKIAARLGARVENFIWDGAYPKKRQWCLDHVRLAYDWVLFIDADEVMTPALTAEIAALFTAGPQAAGYFITGHYVVDGQVLRHGAANRKLALFDRRRMEFPVVDDLDLPMGEIEGHYQPVFKNGAGRLGRLQHVLLHEAYPNRDAWLVRHQRYAAWEAGMNARQAWPADPVPLRETAKRIFRGMPVRPLAAFLHSYVYRLGFLDGRAGFVFACDRMKYYKMIED